jgi:hypothetical protein
MWDFKLKSFINDLKDKLDTAPVVQRTCAISGCDKKAEYRAPKSRYDLKDYYWFCLDHVREYNAKWDYFKGMAPGEVENYIRNATVWDRPTWRSTEAGVTEEQKMRDKIYAHFSKGESVFGDFGGGAFEKTSGGGKEDARIMVDTLPHPTIEALAVLGLKPPVDWDEVKSRYKTLAKKYHPDTNRGDKDAEDLLKKINLAYTILKLSYQHYSELKDIP